MAKLGCQLKGTSKIVKKSFGGVAAIAEKMATAVPASQYTTGVKPIGGDNQQKKKQEEQKPQKMKRGGDVQPPKTKKYFRATKSGAGMTRAGVERYRRENPGSKLKTAVTGKVKPGSKAAKRRKSFCARSAGQMKQFPKAAKDPNSRLRQARRRWKC